MQVTVERVTPQLAEQWLNANNENRSLRDGVVEQYVHDMKSGAWTQCTAPICFYADGDLADGQHRLYAVLESETTQTFFVLRGLARDDGLNIDTGLTRTLVDAGRISGLDRELSNAVISISRAIATGEPSSGRRRSNSEKLLLVNEHREAAEWADSNLPHVKSIANTAVMAAIGRAWYWELEEERLKKFCRVLGTGFSDGDADSAAIAMRNYLLTQGSIASSSVMWRDTFLKVQNAINHFMHHRRLTVIKSVKDDIYPLKAQGRFRSTMARRVPGVSRTPIIDEVLR